MKIVVGCCGWSYLRPKDFNLKDYGHTLAAYARLFNMVEVNSTFYRIPRVSTAQNWRDLVGKEYKGFEFTVKCSQVVTHKARFSDIAFSAFDQTKEVCKTLKAKLILFQSPAGFRPSSENINRMEKFFKKAKRDDLIFIWEPRGDWYNEPKRILELCKEFNIIHCVDPFRNEPYFFGREKIGYFRLHGFGSPSMYNYQFSQKELNVLLKKYNELGDKLNSIYVLFNNATCYEDGIRFKEMLK